MTAAGAAAKAAFSLAGHLGGPCLTILIYHRVPAEPDPMRPGDPDAHAFARRLAFLSAVFDLVPLGEALERLDQGTLKRASLAITFDDGYADNLTVALPILQRYGAPATVFVAAGFVDGGRMWNDTVIEALRRAPGDTLDLRPDGLAVYPLRDAAERRRAAHALLERLKYLPADERQARAERIARHAAGRLPDDLMLSSAQLCELVRAGVEIGAHTLTHPILACLALDAARREITDSGRALAATIARPVRLFAYPNGRPGTDFGPEHEQLVRDAGYAAALTTAAGVARRGTDRYRVPRFTPWDRSNVAFVARLARNMLARA